MNSLFVGGLPHSATETDLARIFSGFGPVTDVKIKRNSNNGKPTTHGFVTLSTFDGTEGARIHLDGFVYMGKKLRVRRASQNPRAEVRPGSSVNSVYVRYSSPRMDVPITEFDLHRIFSVFGAVEDVVIKEATVDERARRQCGYGFVHFSCQRDGVQAAIQSVSTMDNAVIDHITFNVELSRNLLKQFAEMQQQAQPVQSQIPSRQYQHQHQPLQYQHQHQPLQYQHQPQQSQQHQVQFQPLQYPLQPQQVQVQMQQPIAQGERRSYRQHCPPSLACSSGDVFQMTGAGNMRASQSGVDSEFGLNSHSLSSVCTADLYTHSIHPTLESPSQALLAQRPPRPEAPFASPFSLKPSLKSTPSPSCSECFTSDAASSFASSMSMSQLLPSSCSSVLTSRTSTPTFDFHDSLYGSAAAMSMSPGARSRSCSIADSSPHLPLPSSLGTLRGLSCGDGQSGIAAYSDNDTANSCSPFWSRPSSLSAPATARDWSFSHRDPSVDAAKSKMSRFFPTDPDLAPGHLQTWGQHETRQLADAVSRMSFC